MPISPILLPLKAMLCCSLFLAASALRAAPPQPPPLPFSLPSQDLHILQTTTLYTPDQFVHIAVLDRPMALYEMDDFSAHLAGLGWIPEIAPSDPALSTLQHLHSLAPTSDLQQPFAATLQLLQDGLLSWTLDPVHLLYSPGETAALTLTFPLPPDAGPALPGVFTSDLALPLHDALFEQAAIRAAQDETLRIETWRSHSPPELVLPMADSLLVAAGWTPPVSAVPPPVEPGNLAARSQVLSMEALLQNIFRVYHRGFSQLTLMRLPADDAEPAAPPHAYVFLHRTPTAWALP